MTSPLLGRRVLLGVSGSIAAYKSVDLASKLTQAGALVDVLMTQSAGQFVSPLTFRSITHRPVMANPFDLKSPEANEHIMLASAADILVVAPATANTLAKLANGFADDPISVAYLATKGPTLVAPAMDGNMWLHPAVQANVETLKQRDVQFAGPSSGHLASGLEGWGRLLETHELLGHISMALGRTGDFAGKTVVVSAGGTHEPIDPVRVVANRSSGKMGYAIAEAARDRGANVVLVAGPTALAGPVGVRVVNVETAAQMHEAVLSTCNHADVLIMAAAVADYRPVGPSAQKLKKTDQALHVDLEPTVDIISAAPKNIVRVGFAAESTDLLANAKAKLHQKGLDLIAANDITHEGSGFGADTNQVTLLDPQGGAEELPLLPKYDVAWRLLDRVASLLQGQGQFVPS